VAGDDIAEALNLTAGQASHQYTARSSSGKARSTDRGKCSGRFLTSRMPNGTTELDETAADLDQ